MGVAARDGLKARAGRRPAYDAGSGRGFDTANVYSLGTSEQIVGRALLEYVHLIDGLPAEPRPRRLRRP